uniref:Uncharacterized protein n=1 Tax=Rhizophora mucronata TaxID=61149 RepID=A0A2P2MY72_RHIMU
MKPICMRARGIKWMGWAS